LRASTIALLLAIQGATLLAPIPARAGQDCADQVVATCSKCHYPARICEKLGKKSQRDWQATIKRMLRYGLILNEGDQEKILKCLMSLDMNSDKLCK